LQRSGPLRLEPLWLLLRRPLLQPQVKRQQQLRRWLPLLRAILLRVAAQRQRVHPILFPRLLEWPAAALWKGCSQARSGLALAEVRLEMHSMAPTASLRRMIGSWRSASLKLREDWR
jgi:hypothetical protein